MGRKKRTEIKYKQKIKRKKRRDKLAKKGLNPDNFYSEGICMGSPKE